MSKRIEKGDARPIPRVEPVEGKEGGKVTKRPFIHLTIEAIDPTEGKKEFEKIIEAALADSEAIDEALNYETARRIFKKINDSLRESHTATTNAFRRVCESISDQEIYKPNAIEKFMAARLPHIESELRNKLVLIMAAIQKVEKDHITRS